MSDAAFSALPPVLAPARPVTPIRILHPTGRGVPATPPQPDDEPTIRMLPAWQAAVLAPVAPPPVSRGSRIRTWLVAIWRARRSRQTLASLDDRMLRDVGLSRLDALAEAGRWSWDIGPAPRTRR